MDGIYRIFQQRVHVVPSKAGADLGYGKYGKTHCGTNSLIFRGSIVWNSLSSVVKSSSTLPEFKKSIKSIGTVRASDAFLKVQGPIRKF